MRKEKRTGARVGKVDPQARWWLVPEGQRDSELHEHIVAVCQEIRRRQQGRLNRLARYKRAFDNFGLGAVSVSDRLPVYQTRGGRMTVNICRSITNTAASRLAKSMPRPLFAPSRGDYDIKTRCLKLTQYSDGLLSASDGGLHPISGRLFKDEAIFGTCGVRSFKSGRGIKHERCLIDGILIDDEEATHGEPRQLHQTWLLDKDVVKARASRWRAKPGEERATLPADLIDRIDNASAPRGSGPRSGRSQMIELYESWHLPSDDGESDGLHAITIEGATIFSEPYTLNRFPITFNHWELAERGFWGSGLIEEVFPLQQELSMRLKDVSDAMRLTATPHLGVPDGSNFNKSAANNEIGSHWTFDAKNGAPGWIQGVTMPPDTLEYIRWIEAEAYKMTGISDTSAAGRKPVGVESGTAIREVGDIETGRFSLVALDWERFHLRVIETDIMLARQMYAEDGIGPIAKARAGKFIATMKWKDVHLEEDQYEMRLFSTSQLPATPQGRLEYVTELAKGGLIEQREWLLSLLELPDTEEYTSLETAPLNSAQRIVDLNARGEAYTPPEREMSLKIAAKLALNTLLRALDPDEGVTEAGKRNLRLLLNDLRALITEAEPPPPPPALGPGPGGPMPMPGGPMDAGAGAPPIPEGVPQGLPSTPLLPAGPPS